MPAAEVIRLQVIYFIFKKQHYDVSISFFPQEFKTQNGHDMNGSKEHNAFNQTDANKSFVYSLLVNLSKMCKCFFLSFFFDCYSILINGKICHLIVAIQCVHISENENKVNTLFLFFRAQLVGYYRPSARAVWCIRSN